MPQNLRSLHNPAPSGKMVQAKHMSAHEIFSSFMFLDEAGDWMIDGILSRECYETWLANRDTPPKNPQEAFRRTLTSHIQEITVTSLFLSLKRKRF